MYFKPISATRKVTLSGIELQDSLSFTLFPESAENLELEVEDRNGNVTKAGIGSHGHREWLNLCLTIGNRFDTSSGSIGTLFASPARAESKAFLQFSINISQYMYEQVLSFIQTKDLSGLLFYFDSDSPIYQLSPDTEIWIKLAGWGSQGAANIDIVSIYFDYERQEEK